MEPGSTDTISLPMKALINGKVVTLESNGMAFTDFYDDKGKMIIYNDKKATICYTV